MTNFDQTLLEIFNHVALKHPELASGMEQLAAQAQGKAHGTNTRETRLDVLSTFPLFIPTSAGTYESLSRLTIQSINQALPFLSALATSLTGRKLQTVDILALPQSAEDYDAAYDLKALFDQYGSDKANAHNYHYLYGMLLRDRQGIQNILEIGLGTNNADVASNMGPKGKPGASLRAFRDHAVNAQIFGADVDKRILFTEDRIATFYVDQTAPESFVTLADAIPQELDLIIDDGLHAVNANVQTLHFALGKVKVGGWIVIEDINAHAIPVWELVATLLPEQYHARLIRTKLAMVFAVQRLR